MEKQKAFPSFSQLLLKIFNENTWWKCFAFQIPSNLNPDMDQWIIWSIHFSNWAIQFGCVYKFCVYFLFQYLCSETIFDIIESKNEMLKDIAPIECWLIIEASCFSSERRRVALIANAKGKRWQAPSTNENRAELLITVVGPNTPLFTRLH